MADFLTLEEFYGINVVTNEQLDIIMNNSAIYNKIKTTIIPELINLGFCPDIVPLPISDQGIYWSDYPNSFFNKKGTDPDIFFTIYLDQEGKNVNVNKGIAISYDTLKKETKIKVLTLFNKELPNNYEWTGDNHSIMYIHYTERQINKVNFDCLRDDDFYPKLSIDIYMKTKDLLDKDIKELSVMKDLEKVTGSLLSDYEYGCSDIGLSIRCVNANQIEELYTEIENILEKHKKGKEGIKKFKARYDFDDDSRSYKLPFNKKDKSEINKLINQ